MPKIYFTEGELLTYERMMQETPRYEKLKEEREGDKHDRKGICRLERYDGIKHEPLDGI